jgi:hypothetical protein
LCRFGDSSSSSSFDSRFADDEMGQLRREAALTVVGSSALTLAGGSSALTLEGGSSALTLGGASAFTAAPALSCCVGAMEF